MLTFPRGTSLQDAHEKAVLLASKITEGMRLGLEGFSHMGGSPAWRKTVANWISAARRGEGGVDVSTVAHLATLDDEGARKFLELRDFTSAANVLKIVPEKIYWPFLCTATKKAYSGSKYEDLVFVKDEIKGQAAVRRDIPHFVSKCGKDMFKALFAKRADGNFLQNVPATKEVVARVIARLLANELSIEECQKSFSIGTEYAGPSEPMQITLVNKMRARGDDDVPGAGQRVDVVVLEPLPEQAAKMTKAERAKVSSRIEHPDFVRKWNARPDVVADASKQLRLDRAYYLDKLEPSVYKIMEFVDAEWCKRTFASARERLTDPLGRIRSRLVPQLALCASASASAFAASSPLDAGEQEDASSDAFGGSAVGCVVRRGGEGLDSLLNRPSRSSGVVEARSAAAVAAAAAAAAVSASASAPQRPARPPVFAHVPAPPVSAFRPVQKSVGIHALFGGPTKASR